MAERVYLKFHPTRLAFLKWYLLALVLIILGMFVILSMFNIIPFGIPISTDYIFYALTLPAIGFIFIIVAEIKERVDTYIITNFRIIERRGIVNIKEDSIEWENIVTYTFTQSIIEKLLNIGTIRLYSAGGVEHEAEVVIKKTPHIKKIRFLLDKLIQARRR